MTPRAQKFTLTTHITFSVGWFGAVVGFLALAIAGLNSENAQTVRAAYLATELIAWCVILPFCIGAQLTGLIQSLGTQWGLFRYYWVSTKFYLSIAATILLLLHMQPIGHLADVASGGTLAMADLSGMRIQLVVDAVAAVVVLLVNTTISVYKPWGKTRYGLRKERKLQDGITGHGQSGSQSFGRYVLVAIVVLVLLFILLHLAGGGLGSHSM